MGKISADLPEDIEADLEQYLAEEHLDRSTAVRKLLAEGLDTWQKQRVLEKLDRGEVTFMKAAEMADLSVWDFARLAKERNVTWVKSKQLTDDLESL